MKLKVKLLKFQTNHVHVSKKLIDKMMEKRFDMIFIEPLNYFYMCSMDGLGIFLQDDEIYMCEHQMKENSIKEGDEVEVLFSDSSELLGYSDIRHMKVQVEFTNPSDEINMISLDTLKMFRNRLLTMFCDWPITVGQTWYFKQYGLQGGKVLGISTENGDASCGIVPMGEDRLRHDIIAGTIQLDVYSEQGKQKIREAIEKDKHFIVEFMLLIDGELFSIDDLVFHHAENAVSKPTEEQILQAKLKHLTVQIE